MSILSKGMRRRTDEGMKGGSVEEITAGLREFGSKQEGKNSGSKKKQKSFVTLKLTLIEVWNRKWRISAEVKDQLSFPGSAATFTGTFHPLRTAVGSEVTVRIRPRRSSSDLENPRSRRASGFPRTLETVLRQTAAVRGGEVVSDR